jgi:hypothetical protein
MLGRRPVRAGPITYIGKEANELDVVEEGQFHALGEVVQDYGPDDAWESLVLPRLGHIPTRELLRLTGGLDRNTILRTRKGKTRPRREIAARLREVVKFPAGR